MRVLKAGILDTFQDMGRLGYAHLGVAAGGCMDSIAGRIANYVAGNLETEALLEMHFPAPALFFEKAVTIALSGADFGATAMDAGIPLNRRIKLPAGSTLHFVKRNRGQRCYLAVAGGWALDRLMGSYSTHLLAGFGGFNGRALKRDDYIPIRNPIQNGVVEPEISKWFIYPESFYTGTTVRAMPGPEWDWLTLSAQKKVQNSTFGISAKSNRMGYRLTGGLVEKKVTEELLSSGVLPGTLQLLPDGNPLLLMADCQTTGGYPRILQVAVVDLPKLAQMGPGDSFSFTLIGPEKSMDLLNQCNLQMDSLKSALAAI